MIGQQQKQVEQQSRLPVNREIALGIPALDRRECLERCLSSVPSGINRVIVADNGPPNTEANRHDIYDAHWPFEVSVCDLDYDVGIGACRAAIADELDEDYLIVADSDMVLPQESDLGRLVQVLEVRPDLGGASGVLVEGDRFRSGATNFHEESLFRNRSALVQSIREPPAIEWVDETPIARFDKLTNAAVIRQEAVEDYGWDSELEDMEHVDFYVGHWRETDWSFAVCPAVVFDHLKGMNQAYRETYREGERHRGKRNRARERFREKWGFNRVVVGQQIEWLDSRRRSPPETLMELFRQVAPTRYTLPLKDVVNRSSTQLLR